MLSTTDLTKMIGVTPQRIASLVKQLEIPDTEWEFHGRTKFFSPEAVKKILGHRGLSYTEKKIMAFCNNKGGVGKSTLAINTAMTLSSLGYKVLLVDADPQGNATSFLVQDFEFENSLYDVIVNKKSFDDSTIHLDENLHLVPSSLKLSGVEKHIPDSVNPSTFFKSQLISLDYNFIIWDLSPSLGKLNLYSLLSCDLINIVTVLSNFSIQGLEMTNDLIKEAQSHFDNYRPSVKALINMFDSRVTTSFEWTSKIQELGMEMYKDVIRVDNSFNKSQTAGVPLPKNSKALEDVLSFVEQLVGLKSETLTIQ